VAKEIVPSAQQKPVVSRWNRFALQCIQLGTNGREYASYGTTLINCLNPIET
jgi:hypothetical protein